MDNQAERSIPARKDENDKHHGISSHDRLVTSKSHPGSGLDEVTGLPVSIVPFYGQLPWQPSDVICFRPEQFVPTCHMPRLDGYCHGCPIDNFIHTLNHCRNFWFQSPETLQYLWDFWKGLPSLKLEDVLPENYARHSKNAGPLHLESTMARSCSREFDNLEYPQPPQNPFYVTEYAEVCNVPGTLQPRPRPEPTIMGRNVLQSQDSSTPYLHSTASTAYNQLLKATAATTKSHRRQESLLSGEGALEAMGPGVFGYPMLQYEPLENIHSQQRDY